MYLVNNVALELVRTFNYEAKDDYDQREGELDGTPCVELRSPNGRYTLITDVETWTTLETKEDVSGCKGLD